MGPLPPTTLAPGGPPGWYPDPWYPQSIRYWDGMTWTSFSQWTQWGGWAPWGPAPDPSNERTWGHRASVGFWIEGVCGAISAIASPLVFRSFSTGMNETTMIDTNDLGSALSGMLLLQLLTFVGLGATILVAVWSCHATNTARYLGLRTKHSPGWAVAAWIVPIVNWWFPYQVMRDLLPPHHPARSKLGLWWGLHLASSLVGVGFVLGSPSAGGTGLVGLGIGVVGAGCALGAATLGHALATAAASEHERALVHLAGTTTGVPL